MYTTITFSMQLLTAIALNRDQYHWIDQFNPLEVPSIKAIFVHLQVEYETFSEFWYGVRKGQLGAQEIKW